MYREFEGFLDDISRSYVTSDFDTWRRRCHLPLSIVTRRGAIEPADQESLRAVFDRYTTGYRRMGVDTIYRRARTLEDCGDEHWLGTYETLLLARGTMVRQPYVSSALLRPDAEGRLRAQAIMGGFHPEDWSAPPEPDG